jgi:uncharacterized protein (UPF0548 family)
MFSFGHHPDPYPLLRSVERSPLTYPKVGATDGRDLPPGFRHLRRTIMLGTGPAFDRAVAGLRTWQVQRLSGLEVFPADAPIAPDSTVLMTLRFGFLWLTMPCRIVYIVDEPDRFGFAYGTLRGHPERGEEAFVVDRASDGTASFSITAFSRPQGVAALGGPVTRAVQRWATERYFQAMQHIVTEE